MGYVLLCIFKPYKCKCKWTAFIQRISNQWPPQALYNIASHSLIHGKHSHTAGAVNDAWRQHAGWEQLGRVV